jgi:hypothetical protein
MLKDATAIARWYRRIDPGCLTAQSPSYTGEEVRRLIDPSNDDPTDRATTVLTAATVPDDWLPLVDDRRRRTLGSIADRLPTLVALYRAGASLDEMRDRFGGWSTWRYERALEIAFDGIAERLNRRPLIG